MQLVTFVPGCLCLIYNKWGLTSVLIYPKLGLYVYSKAVGGEIKASLFKGKVVVVYGARQVGKTTMVKKIAEDSGIAYSYLNCDELDILSRLQNADNSEALKSMMGGNKLVIIDEAQRVKNIGLKLKLMVDTFPDIQIIATGSSSFDLANEIQEPLTGRNFEFWLFPLSLNRTV